MAWYNANDDIRKLTGEIDNSKKCLEKAQHLNLELEDLLPVLEEREEKQLLPYVDFAEFINTTVLRSWLNMEPLPFYAQQHIGNVQDDVEFDKDGEGFEEDSDGSEEDGDGSEEDSEGLDEDSGGLNEDGEGLVDAGEHLGLEGVVRDDEEATVDVEQDADRLQNERAFGDDFSAIQQAREEGDIGMTQDHFNFINLRERIAELAQQTTREVEQQPDISLWMLDLNRRRQLYVHWVRRYQEYHARRLEDRYQEYEVLCQQMKEIKHGQEEDALRHASVIGMTTTGAAKYRNVLQKIRPKIIVVEEAAEVLEAHIVTALSPGAQHLILIGDHKQLKPNPSVFTLAKQYNLEVSLFERMVRNGMKCHTLDTQHRMRPEIAGLMTFIYDNLKNHVSVQNFEDILGISKNIFFIDHQHPEISDDELKSHSNEHEAKYIVALCQYLLRQGYEHSTITVLTTYTGQLLQLKRLMPKAQFQGVRLCTVDNFQGEENDIILLSLVRSNEDNKIGFLGISNRVCVALSRARKGLYCIGNISMLAGKCELWGNIKAYLEQQQAIGPALVTYCQNHKSTKVEMRTAQDFKNAPEGGCTLPCDFRLDCGHKCEMVCHPVDPEHKDYVCGKRCNKEVCSLLHRCKKLCHHGEPCGPCQQQVIKVLPICNHPVSMPCSDDVSLFKCTRPCEKIRPCGHACRSQCGEKCSATKCSEVVEKILPCGHKASIACSTPIEDYKCDVVCKSILECGHACKGNCHRCKHGRIHMLCEHPCGRTLICSHPCAEPCTKDCPPCQRHCENRCVHSKCGKKCGDPCAQCQEPCTWKCDHKKCTQLCSEICDRKPCNVHCRKLLPCSKGKAKHRCVGLCGEKCPRLCRYCNRAELTEIFFGTEDQRGARFIELLDCGHVFEVHALDRWMAIEDDHSSSIQLKACPKCKTPIRKSLRYGNIIKKILQDVEVIKKKVRENGEDVEAKKAEIRRKLSELRSKYPLFMGSSKAEEEPVRSRFHQLRRAFRVTTPSVDSLYMKLLLKIDSCDNHELGLLAWQIQLLPSIYEIKTKFLKRLKDSSERDSIANELETLESVLMNCEKFTNQLTADINEEIQRIILACKLKILQEGIIKENKSVPDEMQSKIDRASELFAFSRKIDGEVRERAINDLDQICKALKFGEISAEEKAEIVRAIGLSKGHWFKCPNGHIYAIGECGGAMERGKCPECKEVIGGGSHQLAEGNQLAPEMDGALHPAWSDQGNLLNYDHAELRRLQLF